MERRRKRSENWTTAEKELLRQLVAPSHDIIEHKSNTTTMVNLKNREWKSIMIRFNKITRKNRSAAEMKFAWKRLKLATKVNMKIKKEDIQTEETVLWAKTNLQASSDFAIRNSDYQYDEDITQRRGNIEVIVERNLNDEEAMIQEQDHNGGSERCNDISKEYDQMFRTRQIEILEEEHKYNVKIAQLRIEKLELEIGLLKSTKCVSMEDS